LYSPKWIDNRPIYKQNDDTILILEADVAKRAAGAILTGLRVDRSLPVPLHRQLYEELRRSIMSRILLPGMRLPSTRVLAAEMGVSRRTVVDAFLQLYAEGYVDGRIGAGTYVAATIPDTAGFSAAGPLQDLTEFDRQALSQRFREQWSYSSAALSHRLSVETESGAFVFGLPAMDHFPIDLWARMTGKAAHALPGLGSGYQNPAGYGPLREAVASYLSTARGVRCSADRIIIVNGSQQAISLVAHILLNPGDAVWMEEPGYFGAKGALLGAGAKLVPVPVDGEGIDVAAGRLRCPDARMAFVTPSHQMPLGVTMSLPRRVALLEWAAQTKAWVIEDDYDSEYRYASRPLAALQGLDRHNRVIYVGTFSKVLFPSLRLGYIAVPEALMNAIIPARIFLDAYSPLLEQVALAEFMEGGHFERHIRRMRALYLERQGVLVDSARRDLQGLLEVSEAEGGMHLAGWLPEGVSDERAAKAAALAGVRTLPLSYSCLEPLKRSALMLGYAAVPPSEIVEGVRRLRNVLISL